MIPNLQNPIILSAEECLENTPRPKIVPVPVIPLDVFNIFIKYMDPKKDKFLIENTSKLYAFVYSPQSLPQFYLELSKSTNKEVLKDAREKIDPRQMSAQLGAEGSLEAIAAWRNSGGDFFTDRCFEAMAEKGHLVAIQTLHKQGARLSEDMVRSAAKGGQIEVLNWLKGKVFFTGLEYFDAGIEGHLTTVQWLYANYGRDVLQLACNGAAKGGHLAILKWAMTQNAIFNKEIFNYAADGMHFDVMQWLLSNGCPWDERVCSNIAAHGRLDLLQWVRERGCPWDHETTRNAAMFDHLPLLRWARENHCPWHPETCFEAIRNEYWDLLKWALLNGAPHSKQLLLSHFQVLLNPDLRRWIEENETPQTFEV